jgi:hypothetical protein
LRLSKVRRGAILVLAALAVAAVSASSAAAQTPSGGPILQPKVIYKSPPDWCYQGLTQPGTAISPEGTCPAGSTPDTRQAYMWVAVKYGKYIYYGTGSNPTCNGGAIFSDYQVDTPYDVGTHTCQFKYGPSADLFGTRQGDVGNNHVYQVNTETDEVKDISPPALAGTVIGLRGGWVANGIVVLTGQTYQNGTPIGNGLFAFDGATGEYLGTQNRTDITTLRFGVQGPGNQVYITSRTNIIKGYTNPAGATKGRIWRYTGDRQHPFDMVPVGDIPDEAFYMTLHDDHLVVATSDYIQTGPGLGWTQNGTGIWQSPKLPPEGLPQAPELAAGDAVTPGWKELFKYTDFDPDPVVNKVISFGALQSWRGKLIFGTYQLDSPGPTTVQLWNTYNQKPTTFAGRLNDALHATRPVAVFEMSNVGESNQKVRLLYGNYKYSVYDPQTRKWGMKPNGLNQVAAFGPAGYGNFFNWYSWIWTVFQDRLYMGTWDASGAITDISPMSAKVLGMNQAQQNLFQKVLGPLMRAKNGGADLWRMDDLDHPAAAESLHGLGGRSNMGVRTLTPSPETGALYAGTAGTGNLRQNGDAPSWIVKLTPRGGGSRPATIPRPKVDLTAPVRVTTNTRVRFVVKVSAPGSESFNVCVRLPRGFKYASSPGVTLVQRQACGTVGVSPEQAATAATTSGAVVVNAISSSKPEQVVAGALADVELNNCWAIGGGAAGVAASLKARDAQAKAACGGTFLGRGVDAARVNVVRGGGGGGGGTGGGVTG